jgi:hypothetical protein
MTSRTARTVHNGSMQTETYIVCLCWRLWAAVTASTHGRCGCTIGAEVVPYSRNRRHFDRWCSGAVQSCQVLNNKPTCWVLGMLRVPYATNADPASSTQQEVKVHGLGLEWTVCLRSGLPGGQQQQAGNSVKWVKTMTWNSGMHSNACQFAYGSRRGQVRWG